MSLFDDIRELLGAKETELATLRSEIEEKTARAAELDGDVRTLQGGLAIIEKWGRRQQPKRTAATEPAPKSEPQLVVHSTVQTSRPASNGELSLGVLPPGQKSFSTAECMTYFGISEQRVAQLRKEGKLDYKREPGSGCVHSRASMERLKAERDRVGHGTG